MARHVPSFVWALCALLLAAMASQASIDPPADGPDTLVKLAQRFTQAPPVATPPATSEPPSTPAPAPTRVASGSDNLPLGPARQSTPANGPSGAPPASPTSTAWMVQTGAALAGVLALIYVLRWLMMRSQGAARAAVRRNSAAIEVLTRVSLAPRSHVLILRLGHRLMVVGESPAGLRTLAHIKDPDEIAAVLGAVSAGRSGSASAGFNQVLDDMNGEHHKAQGWLDDVDPGRDDAEVHVDTARDRLGGLLARIRSTRHAETSA